MKRRTILSISLSLVLLPWALRAEIVERVVAKVNGEIVTLSEFEARQLAAVQQAHISPAQVEDYLRKNNARILQEAEDELLLVQKAAELDIKVRPEYVKEVIDGIRKENHLDSDQALEEQLRREGLSMEDLKRNISRSILRRQVLSREVESKVSVSEADARAYYDANMETYRKPASVHLEEILLKPDSDLAQEIVARARKGEDFAALAKTYSTARSKESGGNLGTIARGELNPELESIAFALPAKGVSNPIATPEGIRILRVVETSPEKVTPFESVRAEITKHLSSERMSQEYDKFIDGLRKTAMTEVKVREVPTEISGSVDAPTVGTQGANPAAASAGADSEITTSPQAAPERVTPGQAGARGSEPPKSGEESRPQPQPSPSPH
jgi:peptidyl-prolyl cis-trans isomerase SurA